MNEGTGADPLADALLAARLLSLAPSAFGGIRLRGGGPARERVVAALRAALPESAPWLRLPPSIDDERLLGGIDLAASLAGGAAVRQRGLLEEAAGGILAVSMAERLREDVAGKVAQAVDAPPEGHAGFGLVLLDDGVEPGEQPPANLMDRIAFDCDLSRVSSLAAEEPADRAAGALSDVEALSDADLSRLAATAAALGIASARPLNFAVSAAQANAALAGRRAVQAEDLALAARLVLAPRATQVPSPDDANAPSPPERDFADDHSDNPDTDQSAAPPDDVVLEAALAAIPRDVLEQIAAGRFARRGSGGGAGKRMRSALRGKPLGARPGIPRGGARLALIDTLRAAAPWQAIRRQEESGELPIIVRKDDLRIRRFEERMASVTVFCVDASGSAAMARLAEAKGAVELILAQAYVKRSEVALVAFRGDGAEVLLPPTRSLTRARRALADLPGGGGTPLAAGLQAGRQLCEAVAARGRTPFLVVLTDGSANIALDGTPGRAKAREDAQEAARRFTSTRFQSLVIDISPRPRPDAESLAATLQARYLPLPLADAAALQRAVTAAQPDRVPA